MDLYAMDKRLYFESLEELSHKDTWVHYYFENDCGIDLKLLTSGNPILSNEQNKIILKHMFEYIKRSEFSCLCGLPNEQPPPPSPPTSTEEVIRVFTIGPTTTRWI
jgi:hypothetical protein